MVTAHGPKELLVPTLCLSCAPALSPLLPELPQFASTKICQMGQDKDASPDVTPGCALSLTKARQPPWNYNRKFWGWECRGERRGGYTTASPCLAVHPHSIPPQASSPAALPGGAGSGHSLALAPPSKPLLTALLDIFSSSFPCLKPRWERRDPTPQISSCPSWGSLPA